MHVTADVVAPLEDDRSTDCYRFVASDPSECFAQACHLHSFVMVHCRNPCSFVTEQRRSMHTALDTCNLLLRVAGTSALPLNVQRLAYNTRAGMGVAHAATAC